MAAISNVPVGVLCQPASGHRRRKNAARPRIGGGYAAGDPLRIIRMPGQDLIDVLLRGRVR